MNACNKCKRKICDKHYVICELCITYYHLKCLNIGEKEHKVMQEHDGICYLCDECRTNASSQVQLNELKKQSDLMLEYILKVDKAIQEQKVPINTLDHNITCVKSNVEATESHVEELKGELQPTLNEIKESIKVTQDLVKEVKNDASDCANGTTASSDKQSFSSVLKSVCVIKPKNGMQEREITKKAIKERINPVDVSVSGLRNAGTSGIAIVCDNQQSLNRVKNIAQKKMSDKYEIVIPKPILPRVKVSGLEEKYDKDTIKQKIFAQNVLPMGPTEDITILAVRDTKKGKFFDAFIELSPAIYKTIMKTGQLKIDWSVCHVVDAMDVRRCAKCCSYGHLAKKCTSLLPCCLKCARHHDVKDCDVVDIEQCINCVRANSKFGLSFDFCHSANSKDCPVFQRENKRFREKVSF